MSTLQIVPAATLAAQSRQTFSAGELTALDSQIQAIEAVIRKLIPLDWTHAASASVTLDGSGSKILPLRRVLSIFTSISEDGAIIDKTDIYARTTRLIWDGGIFSKGYENFIVTGEWGWEALADVPLDFQQMMTFICLNSLSPFFHRDIASYSIGAISRSFIPSIVTRDPIIRGIWRKYAEPVIR